MNTGNSNRAIPSGVVPLDKVAVRLHPQDDVAIAKVDLQAGTALVLEPEERAHTSPSPYANRSPVGTKWP